jgi:hypothetical protein
MVASHDDTQFLVITETFATEVLENVIKRQNLRDVFRGESCERFFARYAGIVVHSRLSVAKDPQATILKRLLELLLENEKSGLEPVRKRYTTDLCKAVSGILYPNGFIRIQADVLEDYELPIDWTVTVKESLPAAAAAVGNINLL